MSNIPLDVSQPFVTQPRRTNDQPKAEIRANANVRKSPEKSGEAPKLHGKTWKDLKLREWGRNEEKRGETGRTPANSAAIRRKRSKGPGGNERPSKSSKADEYLESQKNRAFPIAQAQQTTRTDKRLGFYY